MNPDCIMTQPDPVLSLENGLLNAGGGIAGKVVRFGVHTSRLDVYSCLVSELTQILERVEQGDPKAADQLLPLVYEELRKLAAVKMAQEKPGQTLQATALVHEASKGSTHSMVHFWAENQAASGRVRD